MDESPVGRHEPSVVARAARRIRLFVLPASIIVILT